ncbi:MAG: serine/threonine protein kinase [Elusimicrobia bacterium]|nr:serine/threonine protein kinase [Elusimicrobiota bacterium]
MRNAALALTLCAAIPAMARAQAVKADDILNDPAQNGQQNAKAGQPDPMQQRLQSAMSAQPRQVMTVGVDGRGQGFDAPTTMVIPTNKGDVRIEIGTNGAPPQAAPPPPGTNYTPIGIAVMLALFGASLLFKRAPAPAAAEAEPKAGANLGTTPFRIVRAIGEGGMGVVYEAIDTNLDRRVAVKRMRDQIKMESAEDQEKLLKEAKTVASLHHPNIVDIHAVVSQGGETYLVFEFVEGKTVDELLRDKKRLFLAEARAILEPVCRALEFAHERGIVHRDLKPANVMITTLGQVKVMDFGIARQIQIQDHAAPQNAAGAPADFAMTNTLVGTPLYQAPEAQFGVIRPEGDVYALGVMAYKMLVGEWPFPPPASVDMKMARQYPKPSQTVPGLPKDVDALIDKALEPEADNRLRSAKEFRERLAGLPA